MKILIVEDDFASSQLLARYLKHEGKLVIAEDGEMALARFSEALASNERFDVILLDIMLPKMNGQDVLAQFRKLEEAAGIGGLDGVKVIMLTALHDAETIMRSFRMQCEAYLPKPINKEKLYRELRNLGLPVKTSS